MICSTCRRSVGTKNGKVIRHLPLFKVPGRKYCPMSGQPVLENKLEG